MTSPIAGEREAFEAWRRSTTKMDPDGAVAVEGFGDDAPYSNKITRVMHIAWKAAWQARAALLEPVGEGWVPVSERLPEHEATVLISGYEGNNPANKRFTAIGVFHKDGLFYHPDEGDDFYPPTHWQPLPKDPQ